MAAAGDPRPYGSMPRVSGQLERTDRHCRGQRREPVRPINGANNPYQGLQRRSGTRLERPYGTHTDIGLLSESDLIESDLNSSRPDLSAEQLLPFLDGALQVFHNYFLSSD